MNNYVFIVTLDEWFFFQTHDKTSNDTDQQIIPCGTERHSTEKAHVN